MRVHVRMSTRARDGVHVVWAGWRTHGRRRRPPHLGKARRGRRRRAGERRGARARGGGARGPRAVGGVIASPGSPLMCRGALLPLCSQGADWKGWWVRAHVRADRAPRAREKAARGRRCAVLRDGRVRRQGRVAGAGAVIGPHVACAQSHGQSFTRVRSGGGRGRGGTSAYQSLPRF